jgi:hypothetical protein
VNALSTYLMREAFDCAADPAPQQLAPAQDTAPPERTGQPSASLDALSDQQVKDLLSQELESLVGDLGE